MSFCLSLTKDKFGKLLLQCCSLHQNEHPSLCSSSSSLLPKQSWNVGDNFAAEYLCQCSTHSWSSISAHIPRSVHHWSLQSWQSFSLWMDCQLPVSARRNLCVTCTSRGTSSISCRNSGLLCQLLVEVFFCLQKATQNWCSKLWAATR